MYRRRAPLIILYPCQEALTRALVNHKEDLCGHLRTQEPNLLEARVLPLGKVLGRLDVLDGCRCLAVPVAGVVVVLLLHVRVLRGVGCGRNEERVGLRGASHGVLGIGGGRTGGHGGREAGGKLGGEDGV